MEMMEIEIKLHKTVMKNLKTGQTSTRIII